MIVMFNTLMEYPVKMLVIIIIIIVSLSVFRLLLSSSQLTRKDTPSPSTARKELKLSQCTK